METMWLKEALFAGQTGDGFKLGTALTLGWFWVRVSGCSLLYRGGSMDAIDFANILAAGNMEASSVSPPSYVQHDSGEVYFYVVRRVNNCGRQERTLAAAVKVAIDADGELAQPKPNSVFGAKARQAAGGKVQLVWYYCPVEQKLEPNCFRVYYDGGTGQIDYENCLAAIDYSGRAFYSYQSGVLSADRYLFAVRAEDADGTGSGSFAQLKIEVETDSPGAVDILGAEAV